MERRGLKRKATEIRREKESTEKRREEERATEIKRGRRGKESYNDKDRKRNRRERRKKKKYRARQIDRQTEGGRGRERCIADRGSRAQQSRAALRRLSRQCQGRCC